MAKLKDVLALANKSELISLCKAGIERAAYEIISDDEAQAEAVNWAKRAIFEYGTDRSQWYATHVLRGLLATDEEARNTLIAAAQAPDDIDISDQAFVALIGAWVQRFVLKGI